MRMAMAFVSVVCSISLVACLGAEPDADIETSSQDITATSTVDFQITNLSNSTLSLDTASCTPSASIFPPFSIFPGGTATFSATASTSILCVVRYQDSTGVQGCQFEVEQGANFGFPNAYKGSGAHSPSCGGGGAVVSATEERGTFSMKTN
jgi:hypothetical protein